MSQTRILITEDHAATRLTVSPLGLQGAPGTGVPAGATDSQIAVYSTAEADWVPTTVLSGFNTFSLVAEFPVTWDPDTVYLKPA